MIKRHIDKWLHIGSFQHENLGSLWETQCNLHDGAIERWTPLTVAGNNSTYMSYNN